MGEDDILGKNQMSRRNKSCNISSIFFQLEGAENVPFQVQVWTITRLENIGWTAVNEENSEWR
jgi:hypothetical protein